jgi:hypothetical protein
MRDSFIGGRGHRPRGRWHGSRFVSVFLLAVMMGLAGAHPLAADEAKPSGTVVIQQTQIAFIGSGSLGGGQLFFQGRTYDFTIGGLGVGGFGISRMTATGNVYNLKDVSQFVGAYAQGRMGITLGASDNGGIWLQNEAGVVMQLKAQREGIALSVGGDAIYIRMND